MSVSRVKTWADTETLGSSDLNAEFDNILNNALSLVSPWTGNMDAGGYRLITLAAAASESSPSIQPTGDTNTGIRFSAADTIDLVTGGADRWQITSAGHLLATDHATYDIGASGGVTSPRHVYQSGNHVVGGVLTVTGGNIVFPATAVPSADANTLDDYEEGTWTVSVGGDTTYTTRVGDYNKIGRLVHIWAYMLINLIGTGSTSAISGCPFTNQGNSIGGWVSFATALALAPVSVGCYVGGGSTSLTFNGRTAASANVTDPLALFGNAAAVNFGAIYEI